MLDKTKNLFTCDKHGNRYEVCHHVRAWVKKEINEAYNKGYAAGGLTAGSLIAERAKNIKPDDNNYNFRSLLIDSEIDIHNHGYECAKDDILGGLE